MSQATDLEAQVATQPDDVLSAVKMRLPAPPTKKPTVPSTLDEAMALAEEQEWPTVEEHLRLLDGKMNLLRDMEYVNKCRLAPPDGTTSFFVQEPVDDSEEEVLSVLQMATQFARSFGRGKVSTNLDGTSAYILEQQARLGYAKNAVLCKFLAERVQRVITVVASKGGAGKTTLIALLGVIYAWLTNMAALLIEGNENGGTGGTRTGETRSNVTTKLSDAVRDTTLVNTHKKAGNGNLGTHWQSSLHVLLSDFDNKRNQFSLQAMLELLEVICEHYYMVFGDTGNGTGYTKAANTGLLLRAHAILLPAVAHDYQTYQELLLTMINMYNEEHLDKLQKYSRVVLNGTLSGDTIEQFIEKLLEIATKMTHKKGEATGRAEWIDNPVQLLRDLGFVYDEEAGKFTGERIFMVPYSQWIKDGKSISVLPEDIGQDTLSAGLEILIECLTMDVQTDEEMQIEIDRLIDMEKAAEAEKIKKIMEEQGIDPGHYKSRRDMRAADSGSVAETRIARLQAILADAADLADGDTDKVQSAISQLAAGIDPAQINF